MNTYKEAQEVLNQLSPIPVNLPKIYFLGDTGAGKTTIIRKILGTDKYNFPTTRQTRTTVAITEYVISGSLPFKGTFLIKPESEIRGYIKEILQDGLAKLYRDFFLEKSIPDKRKLKYIKQTSDQRFRLYYLLSEREQHEIIIEMEELFQQLEVQVEKINSELSDNDDEKDIIIELAIDELSKNELIGIEDKIFEMIANKVKSICDNYDISSGCGYYQIDDVNDFESLINKCKPVLSSESGSVSPIIEYARLQGNILSAWLNDQDVEVVIIDGEGIGHNTKEAGKLDPRHYDYFYNSHSIVLVEESKKPFIAGGKSALKSIYERGYADKLLLVFSKLDEVAPYDIVDASRDDQIEEVFESLNNVISSLEEDNINISLEDDSIFYLSDVHENETPSITQSEIVNVINKSIELMASTYDFSEPEYDYEMLSVFLLEAAKEFSVQYQSMLNSQHWQTIKAFNRRMSWGSSGFRMFTPISDIEDNVTTRLQHFLSNPVDWKENVTDKVKQGSINKIKRELNQLLLDYAHKTIVEHPEEEWDTAISYAGRGSTDIRKNTISNILRSVIPNSADSEIATQFKNDVKEIIVQAITLSSELKS